MAKKNFDIKSTLNKNKTIELPKRIPLKKTEKDLSEVKEKVSLIHDVNSQEVIQKTDIEPIKEETKIEEVEEQVIVKEKKPVTKKKSPPKDKNVRMTIDTPSKLHIKLKIKSIERGMSLRDYVLMLIEKDIYK